MIELEMRIQSDRREGLLVELGRLVVASGFTLQRQRVYQDSHGAWLVMVVRGLPEHQLTLEEQLATHSRVLSFEASLMTDASAPRDSASTVSHAPVASPPATFTQPSNASPDVRRVESMLPQLARDYPKIFPWLLALEHQVAAEAREASLLLAGRRTGLWVFKRDYEVGGKLGLTETIKRVVVPAMRTLVSIEHQDRQIHIQNSPLCPPGGHSGCKFYSGYLEGILGPSMAPKTVFVRNVRCRSSGMGDCILEVSH
jgi:predicted hydrocarbon binding protein